MFWSGAQGRGRGGVNAWQGWGGRNPWNMFVYHHMFFLRILYSLDNFLYKKKYIYIEIYACAREHFMRDDSWDITSVCNEIVCLWDFGRTRMVICHPLFACLSLSDVPWIIIWDSGLVCGLPMSCAFWICWTLVKHFLVSQFVVLQWKTLFDYPLAGSTDYPGPRITFMHAEILNSMPCQSSLNMLLFL